MVIPSPTELLKRYQSFMGRQFNESETKFNDLMDELIKKLVDLGISTQDIPLLTIPKVSFVEDWERGLLTSKGVYNLLKGWDVNEVAHKHLTRKLTKFMFDHDTAADYVKGVLPIIKADIIPVYEKYLKTMIRFFDKARQCDEGQVELTWLEVVIEGAKINKYVDDLTLNQVIRQINYVVAQNIDNSYFLDDNIIVIDCGLHAKTGIQRTHWLFAPASYIKLLRALFDIRESLSAKDDSAYIQKLIGDYI